MADILSTTLSFSQGQMPTMTVAISIHFTQREIAENYSYGINIAVVRSLPDQQIIARHKGMTAMEYFAIPPPRQPLQVGFTTTTVKPDGRDRVDLSLDVQVLSAPDSGQKCQAFATVVPEMAETVNFSGEVAFP